MKNIRSLFLYSLFLLSFIIADPPNWDSDGDGVLDGYNNYQNNGSITSAVFLDNDNVGSLGDLLAAFVGDEIRGVSEASDCRLQADHRRGCRQ